MIQFVLYVLGPFLLMAGVGAAALWLAVGKVRSMRCARRESLVRQHERWIERSQALHGSILYALYNEPSLEGKLEGKIDHNIIAQLEWLRDNEPRTKEIT